MERTLILIRHAKSRWSNPLHSDFDRPLNERGNHDAPLMGKKLKELNIIPDLIIASSAKRTRQTAKLIAEKVGYNVDEIKWEEKLYHCIPSVFDEVIFEVGDDVKTLFIIAHNPGITEYVNDLSPKFAIDHMPTCGMVGVQMDMDEWGNMPISEKKVFLYEYLAKDDQ